MAIGFTMGSGSAGGTLSSPASGPASARPASAAGALASGPNVDVVSSEVGAGTAPYSGIGRKSVVLVSSVDSSVEEPPEERVSLVVVAVVTEDVSAVDVGVSVADSVVAPHAAATVALNANKVARLTPDGPASLRELAWDCEALLLMAPSQNGHSIVATRTWRKQWGQGMRRAIFNSKWGRFALRRGREFFSIPHLPVPAQ